MTRAPDLEQPPSAATGPFHEGERALQARAGMRDQIERIGRRVIRDWMPDQHRELFEKLPALLVGSLDARGCPWASMLVGRPGFIRSPDERTLRIEALPGFGDALDVHLAAGAPVGLLGLEAHTRRRNRANGTVSGVDGRGFSVRVAQSFGNCPQYIHARPARWAGAPEDARLSRPVRVEGPLLSKDALDIVARADTFFIASASSRSADGGGGEGVDVSHRGGEPGFVRASEVDGASALTVPDYRGNFLFNTLGNIAAYPRAGVLFVDVASGDVLQLTGRAEIDWDGPEVGTFPGAQRLLRITALDGARVPGALPLRW